MSSYINVTAEEAILHRLSHSTSTSPTHTNSTTTTTPTAFTHATTSLNHYELKAVVVHIGTAEYGHYIALVRPKPNLNPDYWLKLDDTRVSSIAYEEVQALSFGGRPYNIPMLGGSAASSDAYLLIYERIS